MNNHRFKKSKRVSTNTVDGISFIYLEDTKELIKLDEVANFIWRQVDGIKNTCEIITHCIKHFEGKDDEIKIGVLDFFGTLMSEKLIEKLED